MRCEIIGSATVYLGDCLDGLRSLVPAQGVRACVTDPPYSINTKSDGLGKLNPWADLCNSAFWYAEWFRAVQSRLRPDGCMWSCLNWRSVATFTKASCDAQWPIESMLVWDKDWIGPGGTRGLRPSYELVALFAMGGFAIENRSLSDVQRFKWSSTKPSGHPAEKPEALMKWIITNSTAVGDLVFDPFMGSGTTAAAAVSCGRRFIGFEIDQRWFDHACRRIEAVGKQSDLALEARR